MLFYCTVLLWHTSKRMRQLSTQNNTHAVIFFPPHFRFIKKSFKFLDRVFTRKQTCEVGVIIHLWMVTVWIREV